MENTQPRQMTRQTTVENIKTNANNSQKKERSRNFYMMIGGLFMLIAVFFTIIAVLLIQQNNESSEDEANQNSQILEPETTEQEENAATNSQIVMECPTDRFINVNPDPANGAYDDPSVTVNCNGENMIVTSNNIPDYEFNQITPNELLSQNYTWTVPINPTIANQTTDVPLLGTVAFTVNGLTIFGPTEAPNDGYRDPYLDGILDFCNGHTAPGGVYHLHARPDCLFDDIQQADLILGYALDGFPIYYPYECVNETCASLNKLESSYMQIEDTYGDTIENAWDAHEYVSGFGDLDECNGKYDSNGNYGYYATDTFPYLIGCYRGEVSFNNQGGVIGNGGAGAGGNVQQGPSQQMPPPRQ